MDIDAAGLAGFGSPVASPGHVNLGTPESVHGGCKLSARQDANSPLLFRRTPIATVNGVDSSKKFGEWVMSTSPYAGQKTPPTVSMKSMAAGAENTPPARYAAHLPEGSCNSHRFQAWLKATGRTSWTPKQDIDAATPPKAPPQTPAGTPMSVSHASLSAASPATEEPRSRPIFDLEASDSDSDWDETNTVVGVQEVAAAAARMRAALLSEGTGMQYAATAAHKGSSMVPALGLRAPAPSPVVSSPIPATHHVQQQAVADSLTTPMSQLSMSHDNSYPGRQTIAVAWRSHMTPDRSGRAPSSPVDKVIGLMMEAGKLHGHHLSQQHTPSRLATVPNSQPPRSPEQQVIQLMLQQQDNDQEDTLAAVGAGRQQNTAEELPVLTDTPTRLAAFGSLAGDSDAVSSMPTGSEADYSGSGEESDDDIDVAELQQLVGAGAGQSTPLNDIISMMLTPQLRATSSFALGAAPAQEQPGEGVGPRVLFADD